MPARAWRLLVGGRAAQPQKVLERQAVLDLRPPEEGEPIQRDLKLDPTFVGRVACGAHLALPYLARRKGRHLLARGEIEL